LASPYMHAAIRRDCDGDEAAIMLLSDVLLNFSREYLPSHRGGTQDAPLVLNAKIDAGEVDDQILDFEMLYFGGYPLELYEKAEMEKHSSEVELEIVKNVLKKEKNPFFGYGFTHDTSNLNMGVNCSSYKIFPTMKDKVSHKMALCEKLRSTDHDDVARLVIERHFLGDIRGNFRKFMVQSFRCVDCNNIIRRPPLSGVCDKCDGKLIFTVNEGGIKKYLQPAIDLSLKYNVSEYLRETLTLTKEQIDGVFGVEEVVKESVKG
ncbi:DNA polymerase II large subunit, partial [Candidatus Pacearchaeota archaeon]|nr:DNA polymerase II large subunit [Candidatus Pacearchaeota archaeon]